ncbi:MAG: hypothetical protein H0W69_10950 [Gemmatimonadaceae bacterium]|nr:hypothetical protein [Gemmatimonadaceae bacterium]
MSDLPPHIVEKVRHILPPDLIHDLRTPLGHVLGYAELLRELLDDADQPQLILYTERIHIAAEQLLAMLNENFLASRGPESDALSRAKTPDDRTSTK